MMAHAAAPNAENHHLCARMQMCQLACLSLRKNMFVGFIRHLQLDFCPSSSLLLQFVRNTHFKKKTINPCELKTNLYIKFAVYIYKYFI